MSDSFVAPFPAGPDVSAYVPSHEVDRDLGYLAAKLVEAPGAVGICGPPGVGKTLVLRLLLRRLARSFTGVYVPCAFLSAEELGRWVASQLGLPEASPLPDLAASSAQGGRPLLLAIDEAQLASDALLDHLGGLARGSGPSRVVFAWSEAEGERPRAPARYCTTRVFLDPLDVKQVPAFVSAQLARAQAPAEVHRVLSGSTLNRIALASGGNPRAIQRLADAELIAWAWRAHRTAPETERRGARATRSAPRSADAVAEPRVRAAGLRRWVAIALTIGTLATTSLCTR